MSSGCAAIVEYPDHLRLPSEQILDFGCSESSINRMELLAVIQAFRWIAEKRPWPGVTRVQIISDSRYVVECARLATEWRSNKWRSRSGQPVENVDLWRKNSLAYAFQISRSQLTLNGLRGRKLPN